MLVVDYMELNPTNFITPISLISDIRKNRLVEINANKLHVLFQINILTRNLSTHSINSESL